MDLKGPPATWHWFVLLLPFVCWPYPTILSSLHRMNTGMETCVWQNVSLLGSRAGFCQRRQALLCLLLKFVKNSPMMRLHSSLSYQHRPGTSDKNIAGKQIIKPLPDKTWKGKWCVLADGVCSSPHWCPYLPTARVESLQALSLWNPPSVYLCHALSCFRDYIFVCSLSWIPLLAGLKGI